MGDTISRRAFLETTAATAAVGWSAAQLYAADADAKPGPNETVNVGLIGCGARGGQLLEPFLAVPGVRIVAVCDLNSQRMAEARETGRRREGGRLPRLPQAARRQAHRRGHRGHQRPLEGALPASTPARPARTCTSRSRWPPRSAKAGPSSRPPGSTNASSRSAPSSTVPIITARRSRSSNPGGWGGSAR